MTAADVLVLGGAGVDTIVRVPGLPLPYADSYMIDSGADVVFLSAAALTDPERTMRRIAAPTPSSPPPGPRAPICSPTAR